ncbi:MAG: LacI family DNA-binding transcriptional regulator [Acidobacteriaceae bacterium]|nr:LacI family DNA-binding transcriptional regulator [Acidobacteriaceae bacterium]MBV9779822.1 LacI family DNA-binding transcriptional regulator [Acidobacteriaceae bacterium]
MSLEEVARRAKVSTATVSRVLNNVGVVRSSTRARVMKVVADLNYHPNLHARSLAAGKSRTLGIVVSNMENPFFYDIVCEVESAAHRRGYEIVVANTNYQAEQLVKSIRLMVGRRVAGLAAIVSEIEPGIIDELVATRLPVVFYDVGTARQNITNIRLNYRKGMERVAEYLYVLGHNKRIAFVGHHMDFAPLHERRQGLIEAFAKLSPTTEVRTFAGNDNLEGGWQVVREIAASGFKPTAIVCVNDFMAVGALRALREQGISVPEEVSVTGVDNIKLSEFCHPTLTTVHVPRERIGHIAFEKLIAGTGAPPTDGCEFLIDPDLVIRESTAAARRSS